MGFTGCRCGLTGEALAATILQLLEDWKLDMQKLCGQAYNGAGAMAGARRGVAARILDKYPKAGFVHCASHVLNLCVLKSASIAEVRNVMNVVTSVAIFFNHSPKRQVALDKFITEGCRIIQAKKAERPM